MLRLPHASPPPPPLLPLPTSFARVPQSHAAQASSDTKFADYKPKVAFFFPGQGAQSVGMAKEAADSVPAAKALFERASDILGYDLLAVCAEGALGCARGCACCAVHAATWSVEGGSAQQRRAAQRRRRRCPHARLRQPF